MDTHGELRAIHQEYELYFPECSLDLKSDLATPGDSIYDKALSRRSVSHIKLRTHEDKNLTISVCIAGWHEVGKSEFFPTFEALLDNLSPGFRNRFASELSAKLNNLSG